MPYCTCPYHRHNPPKDHPTPYHPIHRYKRLFGVGKFLFPLFLCANRPIVLGPGLRPIARLLSMVADNPYYLYGQKLQYGPSGQGL